MFDVGFAEILLLSLVGLMVLGPERLPRVARTLGGLARKARSSWLNLKRSIEAEMRAEELKEPLKHFESEIRFGESTKAIKQQLRICTPKINHTHSLLCVAAKKSQSCNNSLNHSINQPVNR